MARAGLLSILQEDLHRSIDTKLFYYLALFWLLPVLQEDLNHTLETQVFHNLVLF